MLLLFQVKQLNIYTFTKKYLQLNFTLQNDFLKIEIAMPKNMRINLTFKLKYEMHKNLTKFFLTNSASYQT